MLVLRREWMQPVNCVKRHGSVNSASKTYLDLARAAAEFEGEDRVGRHRLKFEFPNERRFEFPTQI